MVQYNKHAFFVVSSIGISSQNHLGFCRESISFPAVMVMQYGFRACLFTVPRVEMESGRLAADVLYVGRVIGIHRCRHPGGLTCAVESLMRREDVWKDGML